MIRIPGSVPMLAKYFKNVSFTDQNQQFARATAMPMFDGGGQTHAVLLIESGSGTIWYFDRSLGQVIRKFGRRLLFTGQIRRVDFDSIGALQQLWHYDPWWLLTEERYHDNEFVPALKSTNCVNRFNEKITGVYYRADLDQVSYIRRPCSMYGQQMKKFAPGMLPLRDVNSGLLPRQQPLESGWRVSPFWSR